VETDHDLPRGHSGALWVSAGGAALGLLTAGLLRGRSVALPVPTLRHVVEGLLAEGRIARGYLGVNAYPVSLPPDLARAQGQDRGLILLSVQPESPAARAGLIQGDVLLELRGQPLRHVHDLLEALDEDTVGRELEGRLIRAGSVRPVRVLVGERGAA
jgi:S1-C subfamily serine protease